MQIMGRETGAVASVICTLLAVSL